MTDTQVRLPKPWKAVEPLRGMIEFDPGDYFHALMSNNARPQAISPSGAASILIPTATVQRSNFPACDFAAEAARPSTCNAPSSSAARPKPGSAYTISLLGHSNVRNHL
jgi:hypothetical protein